MSSDSLPSPDHSAAPRADADHEAVCTKIMATARGRRFLTEYVSRSHNPDTHGLVDTIARFEAALRDGPVPQMPAEFARGLADLAAAIEQIETVLAASESSASGAQFAAERIQDIARALRQRDVDAALCDSLEAAAREIDDAIVSHDIASRRASSAAALLHDLARRTSDMIALIGTAGLAADQLADAPPADGDAESVNHPTEPFADETPSALDVERFDDTARQSGADIAGAVSPAEDDVRSAESLPQSLPEIQAPAAADEDRDDSRKPLSLPIPSPLDGKMENNRPSASPSPEPRADVNAVSHAALHDSLAALHALSEEELIALFS